MAESAVSQSHPLDTMLAVSDVIRNDRLAQLYARVLELDSPTVEELAEGIESSTTTVYEDIKHLVEIGLLERVTETQPHRYRASRVDMTIQAGGETFQITPTLLVALAERQSNENIQPLHRPPRCERTRNGNRVRSSVHAVENERPDHGS